MECWVRMFSQIFPAFASITVSRRLSYLIAKHIHTGKQHGGYECSSGNWIGLIWHPGRLYCSASLSATDSPFTVWPSSPEDLIPLPAYCTHLEFRHHTLWPGPLCSPNC